jgi:hypothetical protein
VVELVSPETNRTAHPFGDVRTDKEHDQAWARVRGAVESVVTNGLSNDYDCLDSVERFLFGAYNAARWTLAKRSIGPMSGLRVPFAAGSTGRELSQAEISMVTRAEGWEYASGVMAWLLWIAGTIDDPLPVLPVPRCSCCPRDDGPARR